MKIPAKTLLLDIDVKILAIFVRASNKYVKKVSGLDIDTK